MVDPRDPAALLMEALRRYSPSGAEGEVASFLAGVMESFADEAFVDGAGNAVAVVGHGTLEVTFLGHIDTVPGEIGVRMEEGRLYGRGAVDAKGPLCTAVAAAARLSAAARQRMRLRLIGAVEEEAPSSRGARYAVGAYPTPDLVIIGEPSGWEAVTLGYKGRLVVELLAELPEGHSAGSEPTAAETVVEAWLEVQGWAQAAGAGDRLFDSVQATLQTIDSSSDGLHARCRATVGLRLPPRLGPEAAQSQIEGLLPPNLRAAFRGAEAAYRGPRDTVLTRAFRRTIRAHGGKPALKLKTGTSDMNVIAHHWAVPMLAYGPGDSMLDHTPHEHVEMAELLRATDILHAVLEDLAGGGGAPSEPQSPDSS